MAEPSDSPKTLQITPLEGEHVETDDYFFCKVGDAIPLTSDDDVFGTDTIPSKPLVLSPRFGLVFAAHSTGFCVAKTKDVIDAAKEIKVNGSGSTVKELSVVDVDIGRVSILCLSDDSSCVSAVVGNEIHFFAVDSLLNKDQKPMFSCSVETNHVKDMLWIKDTEQSFIVLTDKGKVHLGAINKPLTTVMDEVDAVEKSLDGTCVAVGRKSNLIILSSQFKEILQIVLPMDSFIEDNSAIDPVRVDSIRWVRSDSIVVGCVQQNKDDEEENYFLQVIMSDDGKFNNDCSTVTAVQFNDLFPGIVDDIVPYGCGPHLFMNYLDKCEFAFVSNRKNTDQHIMLFSWCQGDNQVSVVDIERDNWLPRIELKENGDDNVVLGLCVDETSVYENVEVKVRVEEQRELRPHCLLVCLTLEGKLVLFNVASISGCQNSSQTVPSDDVKSISQVPHSNLGEGSHLEREIPKQFDTVLVSHESNAKNINSERDVSVATPTNGSSTLNFEQDLRKEPNAKNDGQRALMGVSTSKLHENPFSPKDSHVQVSGFENWKAASPDMSLGKNMANTNNEVVIKTSSRVSDNMLTPSVSNSYLGLSGTSTAKSPLFSPASASTESNLSGIPFTSTNTAQNAGAFSGNVGLQPSDSYKSSTVKAANRSQKTSSSGVSETAHSIPNSMSQSREPFVGHNSTNHSVPLMKVNHQSLSPFRQQNAEKDASEQFGNVQDMANELDKLLECIEERGGFRDSCRIAHSSLETLEEGMRSLLERSRGLQNISKERLRETEILLDKTVQVMARKTLMKGIVKQTTNVQYLDLWDRQKLNCELDQKQQSILNLSQDLVNKIIELERHFNALELNRFGESTGANLVSRAIHCRSSTTRSNESLNAIHSSTVSQLAAAQQLSDLLSRQMDLLSVKSPPSKHVSVKKKVFETIGIPLPDDNLISPSSPLNKHPLVSSSGTTHNGFKKSQSSSRSSVLESSRRRRDSLDRNWAKFEAPITTVKRMSIQDEGRNGSGLFSSVDKPFASPLKLQDSIANHSRILSFQDKTGGGGTRGKDSDTIASSAFKWVGASSETSQLRAEQYSRSQHKQGNNISTVQDTSASSSSLLFRTPEMKTQISYPTALKSGSQVGFISKPGTAQVDRKPFEFQWGLEGSTTQNIQSQPPSPPIQYNQVLVPSSKETKSTKPDHRNSSVDSANKQDTQFSSASRFFGTSTGSSTFESGGNFATSGKVFKDTSKEASQIPSSSFPVSSSPAAPLNPILSRGPPREDSSSTGSSVGFAQDSLKGNKPLPDKVSAATNLATSSQSSPELASSSGDKLKSEGLALSSNSTEPPKQSTNAPAEKQSTNAPTEKQSTNAPTEKQSTTFTLPSMPFSGFEGISLSKNSTTATASVTSNTAPEIQSSVFAVPSVSEGTAVGKKNDVETTISQEDEMEEEAPETNQNKASDFSLGSLAGFGIGSAVSSTDPKPNPFGVSLSSTPQTTPTSSPFIVPEGELFRPASFNFQSPVAQQSQSPTMGPSSGGFGVVATPQQSPPAASGFGQPGQIGFGGQQALGSVLGSFGQSRQIGAGVPTSSFGGAPSSGVGGFGIPSAPTGGFAGVSVKTGGFAGVSATSGGFAGIGATASGFAAAAAPGGGFAAAAPGGGFAAAAPSGGGFAAAANSGGFGVASSGGGFGAFSNQGAGGFSAPGGGATGGIQPPSQFTQMRR